MRANTRLSQVAVDSSRQGLGVGRALIEWIERASKQREISDLVVHARVVASGFWVRMRYQIDGEIFQEIGIDHYLMRKTL